MYNNNPQTQEKLKPGQHKIKNNGDSWSRPKKKPWTFFYLICRILISQGSIKPYMYTKEAKEVREGRM